MGFLSIKKYKNKSEVIPLNERDHSIYRVKQVYKVGNGKKEKEIRSLMLTEEGIKVLDIITSDIFYTLHWREMLWFEVRPATKEWVVHTKKNSKYEDKLRFVTHDAVRIHAESEWYLDRFIRNHKLALYTPHKEPDNSCVQELIDEANAVNVGAQLAALAVGGAGN